ncbi:acyl-CoA dehydrogenase family protein [Dehalococcoidia bacterium]|nr:acyl-CoA dehydrogenase family protein [Dehalococcoidia bacterium]
MELLFSPEEEIFRQEVRDFIKEEWTDRIAKAGGSAARVEGGYSPDAQPRIKELRKKLAERNWIAIAWPQEYGGMGASLVMQMIFKEEMAYSRCPGIDPQAYQLGPAIILHGTEDQKKKYLGEIARAEANWCQGFSEPNSGSDLASLQTRAEDVGDGWLISGQKIWTSGAHVADYMHLLARTDPEAPKHRGISYFLFDMKRPGITVKPIRQMNDGQGFNEVFFENVWIPKDSLFGELNRGWYAATTTLDFERSNISGSAAGQRLLEDLLGMCKEVKINGELLAANPKIRHQLATFAINVEVSRMLSYRVISMQSKGEVPNKEASVAKLFSTDSSRQMTRSAMEFTGMLGQLDRDSRWSPLKGRLMRGYLSAACTAGGGSQEIQRNIIAMRGLGLPR